MGSTDRVRKKTEQRAKAKTSAFVVAIGGISGAGKTVVAEKVADMIGRAVTFQYVRPSMMPDNRPRLVGNQVLA